MQIYLHGSDQQVAYTASYSANGQRLTEGTWKLRTLMYHTDWMHRNTVVFYQRVAITFQCMKSASFDVLLQEKHDCCNPLDFGLFQWQGTAPANLQKSVTKLQPSAIQYHCLVVEELTKYCVLVIISLFTVNTYQRAKIEIIYPSFVFVTKHSPPLKVQMWKQNIQDDGHKANLLSSRRF